MIKRERHSEARQGQTVVEFALISVLFVALLLVTFNAVVAFAVHEYLSYAAFMSARALQASDETPERQADKALLAMAQYLPGFNGGTLAALQFPGLGKAVARNVAVQVQPSQTYGPGGPANRAFVRVTFDVDFLTLPLGKTGLGNLKTLRLETRSNLGREVSRKECMGFFQSFLKKYAVDDGSSNSQNFVNGNYGSMEDQGC